mmetsp:Transcript_15303/g.43122  ORF Transcript_15303/g.43122 Transcript_15303/m.43122 type:complete len:278 (+) Transcript_15303:671-1504(+)
MFHCNEMRDDRQSILTDWRNALIAIGTCRPVLDAVVNGITEWMNARHSSTPHYAVAEAVRLQASLGWHNMLKGRWAQEWTRIQAAYMVLDEDRRAPATWTRQAIQATWDMGYQVWKIRCDKVHETDDQAELATLAQKVQQTWAAGPSSVPTGDKRLFRYTSVRQILGADIHTQRQWVQDTQAAQRQSGGAVDVQPPAKRQKVGSRRQRSARKTGSIGVQDATEKLSPRATRATKRVRTDGGKVQRAKRRKKQHIADTGRPAFGGPDCARLQDGEDNK